MFDTSQTAALAINNQQIRAQDFWGFGPALHDTGIHTGILAFFRKGIERRPPRVGNNHLFDPAAQAPAYQIEKHGGQFIPEADVGTGNDVHIGQTLLGELFETILLLVDLDLVDLRMQVEIGKHIRIGIHSRDNDLVVNATRTKQLTNFRVSGKEDAIKITPPIDLSLEYAVEFIEDDELVEITPKSIRVRKRHLSENERKRASRGA